MPYTIQKEAKLIISFDIISSTAIIEDLIARMLNPFVDLLHDMNKFLCDKSAKLGFDIYKFTGDGWILFFDINIDGKTLHEFIRDFCIEYQNKFQNGVKDNIAEHPAALGIRVGLDFGDIAKINMSGRDEFIGRPINYACRIQNKGQAYHGSGFFNIVCASVPAFQKYFRDLGLQTVTVRNEKLKNIGHDHEKFYQFEIHGQAEETSDSIFSEQYSILEEIYISPDSDTKYMEIDSCFINYDEGTIAFWVYVNKEGTGINQEGHYYIVAHDTNRGLPAFQGGYQNLFRIGKYPNWSFGISNESCATIDYKHSLDDIQMGWHNIAVRWKKSMDRRCEFIIDQKAVDCPNFSQHWPEKIADKATIGTWQNKESIYTINTRIARLMVFDKYLDDNWIENEMSKKPTSVHE